jgi:hypothetical protein
MRQFYSSDHTNLTFEGDTEQRVTRHEYHQRGGGHREANYIDQKSRSGEGRTVSSGRDSEAISSHVRKVDAASRTAINAAYGAARIRVGARRDGKACGMTELEIFLATTRRLPESGRR